MILIGMNEYITEIIIKDFLIKIIDSKNIVMNRKAYQAFFKKRLQTESCIIFLIMCSS